MAPSSSGLGRWPFTPEIAGSNPAGVTIHCGSVLHKLILISFPALITCTGFDLIEESFSYKASVQK